MNTIKPTKHNRQRYHKLNSRTTHKALRGQVKAELRKYR